MIRPEVVEKEKFNSSPPPTGFSVKTPSPAVTCPTGLKLRNLYVLLTRGVRSGFQLGARYGQRDFSKKCSFEFLPPEPCLPFKNHGKSSHEECLVVPRH